MPPPSRRLNDKSLNQILTASKSSLVTAGEISNINSIETDDNEKVQTASKIGIPINMYRSLEDRLFEEWKLKPVRDVSFMCEKRYTSPKGRNTYNNYAVYGYRDITRLYRIVQNSKAEKVDVAFERAMMTDSMRYDIMKRDGFRCQLCGRSKEDGVKLQVDHIKPVTKGGKTVRSNLRTLCEQCNRGKSNKYDPDGLN